MRDSAVDHMIMFISSLSSLQHSPSHAQNSRSREAVVVMCLYRSQSLIDASINPCLTKELLVHLSEAYGFMEFLV